MRGVSRSARQVLLVRAALARNDWVQDDLAAGFLSPCGRRCLPLVAWCLRVFPNLLRFPGFLCLRTRFFDEAVVASRTDGCHTVLVLGAGYDTRAWRSGARDLVFIEVDQEATQRHKRTLAPPGGPIFVPADLGESGLIAKLIAAGWLSQHPTLVIAEGVLPYLDPSTALRVLTELGAAGAPGSRLSLILPDAEARGPRAARTLALLRGERIRSRLAWPREQRQLASCGWTLLSGTSARDLGAGTPFRNAGAGLHFLTFVKGPAAP